MGYRHASLLIAIIDKNVCQDFTLSATKDHVNDTSIDEYSFFPRDYDENCKFIVYR